VRKEKKEIITEMEEKKKAVSVVCALIEEQGKIFAAQRGYGPWKDWWEFPGGKIEPGETPREAIIREIREELAVTIEPTEDLGTIAWDYPDFHLSMRAFRAKIVQGRLSLLEAEDGRWLEKEALSLLHFLPADEALLANLRKRAGWE